MVSPLIPLFDGLRRLSPDLAETCAIPQATRCDVRCEGRTAANTMLFNLHHQLLREGVSLSSIRFHRTAAATMAGPSPLLRVALAALLALLATTVIAAPAHADLTNVGAVNPATGFPD